MEDQKILDQLSSIKESINELVLSLNNNLEHLQNSVSWEAGDRKITLVSTTKNVEELLRLAKHTLDTDRNK